MPKARSSKRDIDRTKRERAALKRQRRQSAAEGGDGGAPPDPSSDQAASTMSEQEVLDALNDLHAQFDAGTLDFDDFAATKTDLLNRLTGA